MTQERSVPSEHEEAASLAAVEVLVLWPSEPADAGAWPLFVLVVDAEADAAGTAWLVDHLAGDSALTGHCQRSVTAREAAVVLTTRRHARRLTALADTSQVFDDVLLLGCRTSAKVAGIADLLCANGSGYP